VSLDNAAGKPLANAKWLEAHHRAKLPERTAFARRLAALSPRRIVDLGCATGLWLGLLNEVLPADCEFIGIDGDEQALDSALQRAESWQRQFSFLKLDLEADAADIPAADLTLAFNIFSYI
jgi:ubiquinone/menaquinone biosynthesis C-methylase UbiE